MNKYTNHARNYNKLKKMNKTFKIPSVKKLSKSKKNKDMWSFLGFKQRK